MTFVSASSKPSLLCVKSERERVATTHRGAPPGSGAPPGHVGRMPHPPKFAQPSFKLLTTFQQPPQPAHATLAAWRPRWRLAWRAGAFVEPACNHACTLKGGNCEYAAEVMARRGQARRCRRRPLRRAPLAAAAAAMTPCSCSSWVRRALRWGEPSSTAPCSSTSPSSPRRLRRWPWCSRRRSSGRQSPSSRASSKTASQPALGSRNQPLI